MTRVYVDGQEGTTGLQIRQVLAGRDDVDVLSIDPDKRKDPAERARLLNAADVAFLCLPDAAAREAVAMVENPATCVIDASTAHRTAPGWVYGLPELAPDQARADQGVQAHRQPRLPRHRLHPARAPAGRRRPHGADVSADRHVAHGVFGRRPQDDRSSTKPAAMHG